MSSAEDIAAQVWRQVITGSEFMKNSVLMACSFQYKLERELKRKREAEQEKNSNPFDSLVGDLSEEVGFWKFGFPTQPNVCSGGRESG